MKVSYFLTACRHLAGFLTGIVFTVGACQSGPHLAPKSQMEPTQASRQHDKPGHDVWKVATYKGLTLGKSRQGDVERLFGKPIWTGPPEEKLINRDPEPELLYEYFNVGGVQGRTTVVFGARTGLVKAIDIYPERPFPLKDIINEYGTEYHEKESDLGPCPGPSELRRFKPPLKRKYPFFLVYPALGMYVAVDEDTTISHIGYLVRCP